MKIGKWLMSAPALMVAGLSTAQASEGSDILCRVFHWNCPPTGGDGGGTPHAVPEPQMLVLFTACLLVVAVSAYRRYRKQTSL